MDCKSHAYKLMDCKSCVRADGLHKSCVRADGVQKCHAYELLDQKNQKDHVCKLTDRQIHTDERTYQKCRACELMDQKNHKKSCVQADGSGKSCVQADGSEKSHACEIVLVSECGKMLELKSWPTIKEIAIVKMQT